MKETKTEQQIGLWLDHTKAHFIDVSNGTPVMETVFSDKESQVRIEGEGSDGARLGNHRATNNEIRKHNRDRDIMNDYFKMLANRLMAYDDIFLFGPTTAKDQLYNHLKESKSFTAKTINIQSAGHLTENQMVAEVKKFFNL
ncbi:MAG: hypothetical protein IPP77_00095 [Bacteroidetes bacterium]|nr:hypothetical protein [Bacteroidota bacterium]